MEYVWLNFSLLLLVFWVIIYYVIKEKKSRKKMLTVSLITALLGFTEPIFVPEYWSPLSLFDLALRIGFDIESIIFSFAVGGIVVVVYEIILGNRSQPMTKEEMRDSRHRFHKLTLVAAPILFVVLLLTTNLNPIYSAIIAMFFGFFTAWYCRPDLLRQMLLGGLLFTLIYFLTLSFLPIIYPTYVETVWNLSAISGVLIVGIPLEEYLWAFTFGLYWSSIYEHFKWRKLTY